MPPFFGKLRKGWNCNGEKRMLTQQKMNRDFYNLCIELIESRGVPIKKIAEITFDLQKAYLEGITIEDAETAVRAVLHKREAQFAIMTGLELDRLCEEGKLQGPIADIIKQDFSLYGVDEILALSVVNIYGSIGLTNFGYLDKAKNGIIREIDEKSGNPGQVNTFFDDLLCAIAAAAASKMAHQFT
jgi:phosphatidylglycerophosphatase A